MSEPPSLQALAAARGGSDTLFDSKVAAYVASRPDYPAELFDWLVRVCPASADVADIGAGTGLLTRGLLERGYRVCAVEPNAGMRAAADSSLAAWPGYSSCSGHAEALPLAGASLDLVTAAQAFHWFDVEAARREALRVLRPKGWVLLVWNDRDEDAAIHQGLSQVMRTYGGELQRSQAAQDETARIERFFGHAGVQHWEGPQVQRLDLDGFCQLLFSRSYMPAPTTPAGQLVMAALAALHTQHADPDGRAALPYLTRATLAQMQA